MLQEEHSAIHLTFIKLLFVIKVFVLSFFEWLFYTGFTVFWLRNKEIDNSALLSDVMWYSLEAPH